MTSQRELAAIERIKGDIFGAIDRAIGIVCELTKERRTTRLSIPVDFNRDEDVILIDTLLVARCELQRLNGLLDSGDGGF